MSASAALRIQIENSLETRFPSALSPVARTVFEVASTGIDAADQLLGGGLPVGAISEIAGPASSGRTSLALAFVAQRTLEDRVCAWVDAGDAFDPESAAANGVNLRQLLWVRCSEAPRLSSKNNKIIWTRLDHALRATDLLLQAAGFAAIVLDLGDIAPEHAGRIPLATWFRFRQAADRTRCSLVVLGQTAYAQSSAAVALECELLQPETAGGTVLRGFTFKLQRGRQRFSQVSGSRRKTPVHLVGGQRLGCGEARMSAALYACVHAAEFPAQALLRLRPDMRAEPMVVIEGRAPHEFVCSMNRHAFSQGIVPGMTRLDVEGDVKGIGGVKLLARSPETEAAARAVLLECVAQFSPRIEEAGSATACSFVLDITGTGRLFGPPAQLAARMRSALAASGFRVSIAISANFHTACIKAAATHGTALIAEGEEAPALANLSLASLRLEEDRREIFAMWGIRTLGELAVLPETELIARLGAKSRAWRELARGIHPHLFLPLEPEFTLREFCAFDSAVEDIDSLLFVGARMIDCLVARAADRALSLALVRANMYLDGGMSHECVLRPAVPSTDRKFLLKLLQLEIGAHPPPAGVVSLELTAEAGRCGTVQLGLFAPQMPEPSRLDVTLARIRAIVGDDRVGSPVLEDTHRPGSFRMEGFAGDHEERKREPGVPRMALRCLRPPLPIRMTRQADMPVSFRDPNHHFDVTAAYGPWRTSGCWWSEDEWDLEEWDVLAERNDGSSVACLLVCDRSRNEWRLEAFYD